MKALIRGKEVYPENEWSDYTRNNLAWYIGAEKDEEGNLIPGGGWKMIENYQPRDESDGTV